MIKSKKIQTLLLTTSLTLGLSLFIPINAYAATYTAVSGDSLYKIGQLFATTTTNLMEQNDLKSTSLNIGQVLTVPCTTYTVKKGDTLFLIAQKYKIPLAALRRANNTYTNNINIGQILNIPPASSTVSQAAPPTALPVEPTASPAPTTLPTAATTSPTAPVTPPSSSTTITAAPEITPAPESAYSASDLDLLSRLITAEAQGESYDAQVAVGAVVMNRVKSASFPNSINEVIYQNINGYYQFTPVVNGWIDKPAEADSIKAAKAVLGGLEPTNGALFYYDNTTTNPWMLAKPISVKIGNMIFAY